MTNEAIRAQALEILLTIAPELEPETLRPDRPLRQQVELDSVDWLNFVIALHKAFAVDIPETDYRQLTTLDAIVAYLAARVAR